MFARALDQNDVKRRKVMRGVLKSGEALRGVCVGAVASLVAVHCANAALTRLNLNSYNDFGLTLHYQSQGGGQTSLRARASALDATYQKGDALPFGGSSFIGFSLSIPELHSHSGLFDSQNDSSLDSELPNLRLNSEGLLRAASLYEHFATGISYAHGRWTGKEEGAALQLAIWDVLYGDGSAVNNPRSAFYVSGADLLLVARANQMLSSSANQAQPNPNVTFWNERPPGHNHESHGRAEFDDVLIGPSLSAIPEAGTYFAGVMALLYCGMFWIRHRNK